MLIFYLEVQHTKHKQTQTHEHEHTNTPLNTDHAVGDMSELRLQEKQDKQKQMRKLDENWYIRGEGTCVYFWSTEYLGKVMKEVGFEEVRNEYANRTVFNHKRQLEMNRIFAQACFRKPNL